MLNSLHQVLDCLLNILVLGCVRIIRAVRTTEVSRVISTIRLSGCSGDYAAMYEMVVKGKGERGIKRKR